MSIKRPDENMPSEKMNKLLKIYLEKLHTFSDNEIPELEVKFGTKGMNISKINFNNVIQSLLNFGFNCNDQDQYLLRIMLDNTDDVKKANLSNIRTEINGFSNIQNYCINNSLPELLDDNYNFIDKSLYTYGGITYYPIDFNDFNFRISYNVERQHSKTSDSINALINNWKNYKKMFRYIKRYRFTNSKLPFGIDLSIVKSSSSKYGKMVSTYNIKDSNVFNNSENYEIEIELVNPLVGVSTQFNTDELLVSLVRRTIKYILIGLQETNFPVSRSEQLLILNNYFELIKKRDYKTKPIVPNDFIGPSSVTLQMENLQDLEQQTDLNSTIPNIRKNYTVTDKADGYRKLMFINGDGKIYLINTNMNVQFTGALTKNNDLFNSIIDGEHILNDKHGKYINLFVAFDIYYINNKNITGFPLSVSNSESDDSTHTQLAIDGTEESNREPSSPSKKQEKQEKQEKQILYRLHILSSLIKSLKPVSIMDKQKSPMEFDIKKFYSNNIFLGAKKILNNATDGLFKYNTDGLIFTPIDVGVASDKVGFEAPNFKTTWMQSFKWKPPEFNTIDFLISIKRTDGGDYFIGNKFNKGINMNIDDQIENYYTLILRVGFDERRHGYINPCQNIIDDKLPNTESHSNKRDYKPVQFYPTNPTDNDAGITNIMLKKDKTGELKIFTEEHEEIEDNVIVEFRYDITKESGWRWTPLRIRYDKTQELRSGLKNFGNAYHTANNNWHSIHYPITDNIITSGLGVMKQLDYNDIYYNKNNKISQTKGLRDFHNLYVKHLLIKNITNPGSTLIDYAVGKGGDLPKWIFAKIAFVLGIDLSRDNVENRLDGACARYLNYCKKFRSIPDVLFLHGNTSVNIKSSDAFSTDKNKQIIKALFGEGTKDETVLGKGVYKNYGLVKEGFNISSIQFALHYMFENTETMHNFIKNVSECTILNGYFIGTCYDGLTIFNMLKSKTKGESTTLYKNGEKIWEVTKQYNNTEFNNDDSSIGCAIDVYQESINKVFREYLVNFTYFIRVMENYGFVLLSQDELIEKNLRLSTGMFDELYNNLESELKLHKEKHNKYGEAINMSDEEKTISFLNRYFVFKKIRNQDSESIKKQYKLNLSEEEIDLAEQILNSLEKEETKGETSKTSIKKEQSKPPTSKPPTSKPPTSKPLSSKKVQKTTINNTIK